MPTDKTPEEIYALEASNAKHFGLALFFSDESEICGFEDAPDSYGCRPGRIPVYFAQLDAPEINRVAIFQGPARDLGTFLRGFGWGRVKPANESK